MENKKKKNTAIKSFFKFISVLIVLFMIVMVVSLGLVMYLNSPVNFLDSMIYLSEIDGISLADNGAFFIDVRRGESSQSVGLRLERAGLIRDRYFWNLICRLEKEHIKTGTYKIEEPLSQIALLKLFVSGKQILYRVTIPEGVTLKRAARILDEAGICSFDDFLASANDKAIINDYNIPASSMEGYLFPDTYFFPKEYPADKTVRTMADNFFGRIENISPSVKNMSSGELNRIVILASIVEREYRIAQEAPLMAGVFYNRLNINMALQSCATVEYIITEIQGKPHPSVLYNSDLEIRSPYNTYQRPGLPPGPISAPGEVALKAAIYPQSSNYFYFRLTDPASGRHYFSRTLDEHIRAGQLFVKPAWR
ncbi:MAG: endolytic transglycosylase MltG [Treponema sp.]|nr:endolytic transglycosylase MltG [Treponema sp.]